MFAGKLFNIYCVLMPLLSFFLPVGHGQSEGDRMNIRDFQVYIRDSLQHIDLMKSKHPDLPIFIVGHSMVGHFPGPSRILLFFVSHSRY